MHVTSTAELTRGKLPRWLDSLRPAPPGAVTLSLPPGADAASLAVPLPGWTDVASETPVARALARDGAVAFWSEGGGYIVTPPFPPAQAVILPGWDPTPLRALLECDRVIGVVLLRLGEYAVGVFEGESLLVAKTDQRIVHARHHKGGSSAARFARRRRHQAHDLFKEVCEVVVTRFGSVEQEIEWVFLGGDQHTLDGFMRTCPELGRWRQRISPRRLTFRHARRDTLEEMGHRALTSRVFEFAPEQREQSEGE